MDKRNKFYITTPLYYVNAAPHIGHSYTNIAADCLARHMRGVLGRENVWFLTGTDEHGQKIEKAAGEMGLSPQEFADKMVFQFKDLWKGLNISYDDFIRTTEDRHVVMVKKVLDLLYSSGDIYPAKYYGWYCTPCEAFWQEAEINVIDSAGYACPDCRRPLEKIEEENYFFRLSKYQDWLIDYIKGHTDFIRPQSRYNEAISFLTKLRLSDLCISRPKERLKWGIPLPFSSQHVAYVWFDALINYISAVGTFDQAGVYRSRWWPADLHLIGKDILRQHAIYWPIMLRALNIEPPGPIFAHGWWMVGEAKMSKSRGNVVSPKDIAESYGVDVYRYFLLRDVPFGQDGNFSEEAIIKRFNSDLANDLGNLVYRTLTMIEKYFEGSIPAKRTGAKAIQSDAITDKIDSLEERIMAAGLSGPDFNFSAPMEGIWELINTANKYIEDTKPWILAKENRISELEGFILILVDVIRVVERVISPFMPKTAESIKNQLGRDTIKKDKPLFPRIDKSKNP
ncbi:MAG: methionine--tRNA ligase [Candidatus Omnitrophota bacterium]